jgi:hypothetical protein
MPDPEDQQEPAAGTDGTQSPATAEATADDAAAEDAPAEYANRAARRARGKGASPPPPAGKGPHLGGRGSVQGPRQWGNRRSG